MESEGLETFNSGVDIDEEFFMSCFIRSVAKRIAAFTSLRACVCPFPFESEINMLEDVTIRPESIPTYKTSSKRLNALWRFFLLKINFFIKYIYGAQFIITPLTVGVLFPAEIQSSEQI